MDNSSQNPYIPQESEQIRQQVYEHQSPLGKVVKVALIATIVVAVLVGIGLFFVIPRTTAVDQPAREKLANELQPTSQTQKRVSVESDKGFKLSYDNNIFSSYAEVGDNTAGTEGSAAIVSGQTYDNNELRVTRAYNYVRIRPVESVETSRTFAPLPPELNIFATVTQKDLTAAAGNQENKNLSKLNLFIKLDTDKRLEKKVADDNTVVNIEVTNAIATKIGDIDYQKVRFTTTNENHRVANVKYDDCYYTIQNDVPYSVCVTGVRPSNVSAASLVEQVISSISYQKPKDDAASAVDTTKTTDQAATKKTSYALPTIRLAQATKTTTSDSTADAVIPGSEETDDMSPLLTLKPEYNTDDASLKGIAKNQPSVVRLGTIYCADLNLKYQSGETATTLTDACTGSVSSGVIISRDGYVATTGHAIKVSKQDAILGYINSGGTDQLMNDRLQRVLDYLMKSGFLMQTDVDYIVQGAKLGDQEALAKIENLGSLIPDDFITVVKEDYSYAVQPGDKEIVVNRTDSNKPSFAYSDSILKAKSVAANYETKNTAQLKFTDPTPTTDVGILKIDSAAEFQHAPIAASDNIKADDVLSTIGYSAYTDSSLVTSKIRNMPIVTTNKVVQAYDKDGTRLIQTDVPVLPGNDGAPVVNADGDVAGFAVYGFAYCPGQQCFANGTVRSSAELLKLINASNIKLDTSSSATKSWRDGVDQYFRANYSASTSAFANAGSDYALNRWAEPLNKLSRSNQGNSSDTSLMNQLQVVMIAVIVILVVATILLAIALFVHKRRISQLQTGHYGAAVAAPVQAPVYQAPQAPQPYQPPLQPSVRGSAPLPPVQNQAPQPYQQPQQYGQQPPQQYANPQAPTAPQYPEQQNQAQQNEDPFYK